MTPSVWSELDKYPTESRKQKENALKEILQEIILSGLTDTDFFDHAAFYGGTALRIFYNLNRFSEDLDFSLTQKEPNFALPSYFPAIDRAVNSYGFHFKAVNRHEAQESTVQTGFLKGKEREHMLLFFPKEEVSVPENQVIKIKFEIDTDPDPGAHFVQDILSFPRAVTVRRFDGPSLFAGKTAAVLNRNWKNRVKGRDLYDYVFYLQNGIGVNLDYLWAQIKDGYQLSDSEKSLSKVKELLNQKFDTIDYEKAILDVTRFLGENGVEQSSMHQWSPEYFKLLTEKKLKEHQYPDSSNLEINDKKSINFSEAFADVEKELKNSDRAENKADNTHTKGKEAEL